ncbi:MAG: gfo/Idh/MocA family oxidoreductase [bacterium]|nr:gfo/Idh/MocA family oxidoreductase [bacterium]
MIERALNKQKGLFAVRIAILSFLALILIQSASAEAPLHLAIVGLVHGHVGGFLNQAVKDERVSIDGVFEPRDDLRDRYAERYSLDSSIMYDDLNAMLDQVKPEAVAVFTSTFDHCAAVEACAKRGIHVMMEKPLAVGVEHAERIETAARNAGINVIVNYETTWYPSNRDVYNYLRTGELGDARKFVVHDGHQGPKEIGCGQEFLDWLTDPTLNGAGALFDFGCYGANLITWMMNNQRPLSVTAVTQQIKPDIYPNVDDEATIILTYPQAQGIIQASWNWPFNRKDIEVYGKTGYAFALDHDSVVLRVPDKQERQYSAEPLPESSNGSISYLYGVVRGKFRPAGLSSLENNMIVTEILDAARKSAASGETVYLE